MEYKKTKNEINYLYKLKNEKELIKYNLRIEKLNMIYEKKIEDFQFDYKIEKAESIIKINEMVYKTYMSYKKNFYNCVNVNNILACNLKNKLLYEKLKKNYEEIINDIMSKYNQIISLIKKNKEGSDLLNKQNT